MSRCETMAVARHPLYQPRCQRKESALSLSAHLGRAVLLALVPLCGCSQNATDHFSAAATASPTMARNVTTATRSTPTAVAARVSSKSAAMVDSTRASSASHRVQSGATGCANDGPPRAATESWALPSSATTATRPTLTAAADCASLNFAATAASMPSSDVTPPTPQPVGRAATYL